MDLRRAFENLRAEAMLGMEVGERQNQAPPAGELLGAIEHLLSIDRPHAGVDDQRGIVADNDPDIRHERDAAVGDDKDAGGDFLQAAIGIDGTAREARYLTKHHSLRTTPCMNAPKGGR